LSALATMGAFEFTREAVRKPYVIANYMYGNSLYTTPSEGDGGFTVENIDKEGILKTALWINQRDITDINKLAAGGEIFRVECQSCHTVKSYRGLQQYLQLRQWDAATIREMVGSLDVMHNGVMPPFTGKERERDALTAYLDSIHPKAAVSAAPVFERYCAPCHQAKPDDSLFTRLGKMDPKEADEAVQDLPSIFVRMPGIHLKPEERTDLILWVRQRFMH